MTEKNYRQNHVSAKIIVSIVLILLVALNRSIDIIYLDVLTVLIWVWGVNTTAYVIETLRGHRHNHDKV